MAMYVGHVVRWKGRGKKSRNWRPLGSLERALMGRVPEEGPDPDQDLVTQSVDRQAVGWGEIDEQ